MSKLQRGFTLFEMALVLVVMGVMAYTALRIESDNAEIRIAEAEGHQLESIRLGAENFLYDFTDTLTLFDNPTWLAAEQTDPTCLTTAPTCKFATGAAKLAWTGLNCSAATNECNFPNTSTAVNGVARLRAMGYLGAANLAPRYSDGSVANQYQIVFKRPVGAGNGIQGAVYSIATWMRGSPTLGLAPDMPSIGKALAVMGAGGGYMANAAGTYIPCRSPNVIFSKQDPNVQCPVAGAFSSVATAPYNFTPNINLGTGARLIGLINNKSSSLNGLLRTDGSDGGMKAALRMNGNDVETAGAVTATDMTATATVQGAQVKGTTSVDAPAITGTTLTVDKVTAAVQVSTPLLSDVVKTNKVRDPGIINGAPCSPNNSEGVSMDGTPYRCYNPDPLATSGNWTSGSAGGSAYATVIRCGGGAPQCAAGWTEVPGSRFIAPAGLGNCGSFGYVSCTQ